MSVGEDRPTALTIVLAMQRSGSTLLGRDLESLGGLGSPREHFRGFADEARRRTLTEDDVLQRLTLGTDDEVPSVTAVKLQVSQAAHVAAAITGTAQPASTEAISAVVAWARKRFERLLVVVLFRNALDMAISRAVVQETGTYMSSKPGAARTTDAPTPSGEDLNPRILAELSTVIRHRGMLQAVAAAHADVVLTLTYEELTGDVEACTRRLVAHARAQGFEPRRDTVTRTLTKVITAERSVSLRTSFLDYLATESGRPA